MIKGFIEMLKNIFGEIFEISYTKNGINQITVIRAANLQKAKEKFGKKHGLCENVRYKRK